MDSKLTLAWLAAAVFAVWRVAHLLWGEDGPWDAIARFRRLCGNGMMGRLLDCFYCVSLWVAAPAGYLLGATWSERIVLSLALSGGAILLQRTTSRGEPTAPVPVWQEIPNADEANR